MCASIFEVAIAQLLDHLHTSMAKLFLAEIEKALHYS